MDITVKKIIIGPTDNNCYVVYTKNNKAVVVDAPDSGSEAGGIEIVLQFLKDNNLETKYILLTHGHYDHIGGLDKLIEATGGQVVISEGCNYMLKSEEGSLGMFSPYFTQPIKKADILVDEGDQLVFDDVKIKVHLVSGHTEGDLVYEISGHLFTGDTLFAGDIGRGDLPGGDLNLLIKNLKELIKLDENFKVHPGHGPDTTISHEKRFNHYLK